MNLPLAATQSVTVYLKSEDNGEVLEIAVDPPRLKEGRDSRDEHPEGHPRHARRGDSSRIRATMPDVRVQRSVSA